MKLRPELCISTQISFFNCGVRVFVQGQGREVCQPLPHPCKYILMYILMLAMFMNALLQNAFWAMMHPSLSTSVQVQPSMGDAAAMLIVASFSGCRN